MLVFITITSNAQNWLKTLNSGATTVPKFGLSTNHALSFFTNNVERMKLTNTGRLGIGQANPAYALDVTGEIRASTNVRATQKILFGSTGQLQMAYSAPAIASDPGVFTIGNPNVLSVTPDLLCGAINLNAELQNGLSITKFTGLINMSTTTNGPALNFAAVTSGATIFSRNSPLYINKCGNDVNMCSDGMGNVGMGAVADANTRLHITGLNTGLSVNTTHASDNLYNTKLTVDRNRAKALTLVNTVNTPVIDETFTLYGNGQTYIGKNLQQTNNAALTVGQTVATNLALCLTDNNNASSNSNFFNVYGNGQTFVGKGVQQTNGSMFTVGQANKNALALSLTDNTNIVGNKDFFNVYGNGYTEIKVYTPASMPLTSYSGVINRRVFTIRDASVNNKDLFVVTAAGKVYAREVEISAASVLNFPDYVFDKSYNLKSIKEVDSYIAENKHLPGFEPAAYYEKNGLNVSNLFIKQQEKIEEMMLYIIELEKRLQQLEKNK